MCEKVGEEHERLGDKLPTQSRSIAFSRECSGAIKGDAVGVGGGYLQVTSDLLIAPLKNH